MRRFFRGRRSIAAAPIPPATSSAPLAGSGTGAWYVSHATNGSPQYAPLIGVWDRKRGRESFYLRNHQHIHHPLNN